MSYKLYYSPDSANLVVRMALEEMDLPYQHQEVPRKRADRDADFHRLNPRGLLPVLIDEREDLALFETGAILLYLADRHGALVPNACHPRARGILLKWLFMLSNTLHADLNMRFYPERYVNDDREIDPLLLATKKRVQAHFRMIDETLGSQGSEWFLESGLSICDFYLGCCVRWAQMYPVGDHAIEVDELKQFRHLTALLTRLQNRESVNRALAEEGISGNAFVDVKTHLPARVRDMIGTVMP